MTAHTLLSNPSFAGAAYSPWVADAVSGACAFAIPFAASASHDKDSDGGGSIASTSTGCDNNGASFAVVGESQTFSIAGASPSAQAYSFWYETAIPTVGDAADGCLVGSGAVGDIVVKINGTTVATVAPVADGGWHQVSGTTTALVTGSNSFDVSASISGAKGVTAVFEPRTGTYVCRNTVYGAESMSFDDFSVMASW